MHHYARPLSRQHKLPPAVQSSRSLARWLGRSGAFTPFQIRMPIASPSEPAYSFPGSRHRLAGLCTSAGPWLLPRRSAWLDRSLVAAHPQGTQWEWRSSSSPVILPVCFSSKAFTWLLSIFSKATAFLVLVRKSACATSPRREQDRQGSQA